MRTLLILLLLVLFAPFALAEEYTHRDGYWYNSAGQAYTRERAKCYYNGNCWYWCWKYTPHVEANTDWRTALVKLADAREAEKAALEKAQEENKAFIESVNALGLGGSYTLPLQGLPTGLSLRPLASHFNLRQVIQSGFNAEQGDTIFSVAQLSDIYNQNDLSVLFQQASQLAQNAQELGGVATEQFNEAIVREAEGRQRVAEIIAKSQLIRETLRSVSPPVKETIEVTNEIADVHDVINAKCIRCHNTDKNKVNLSKYDSFTPEQKELVFNAVAEGRMPKGGNRLKGKEVSLFLERK